VWTENGVTFYQLSSTTAKTTLVLNLNNKEWFDVSYRNNRHFAQSFAFLNGKKLVTSYLDGNVYEMSEDYLTNSGEPWPRQRVTSEMRYDGYKRINGETLEIYFQQGVGLSGQYLPNQPHYVFGADPVVYLYTSFDGGQTWSQPKIASLGRQGERVFFTKFYNLGSSKGWSFKIEVWAPVKVYMLGAYFTYSISPGSN
jgi:hypothetical protein